MGIQEGLDDNMRIEVGDLVKAKPHVILDAKLTSSWSIHDSMHYNAYSKSIGIVVSVKSPLFSNYIVRVYYPYNDITTYFNWIDECFVFRDGEWVDPKRYIDEGG